MALSLLDVKVGVTRIGAFVVQTIALIIPRGVDLNQEERVFSSGLDFFHRTWLKAKSLRRKAKNKHEKCRLAV
ncbi:MAG: hypothetical protein ACYC2W_06785 [Desulfurivibrionaceae bacterium]